MLKLKLVLAATLAMIASGCSAMSNLRGSRVETLPAGPELTPLPIPAACRKGPATEPEDPSDVAAPPTDKPIPADLGPDKRRIIELENVVERLRWRLGVIEPRYQPTRARETTNAERLENCRSQLPPVG